MLPSRAGIGLRERHFAELGATGDAIDATSIDMSGARVAWFEVHTENYMGAGGMPHRALEAVRRDHPLSLHGVGLSLGSADGLDLDHVRRIAEVARRYQPEVVSEHLSWSASGGVFLDDLLPLPYTEEALDMVVASVDQVQSMLGRQILIENPSTYLRFNASTMTEVEFLSEVVRRAGCAVLLDVNNVFVSARNHLLDPVAYLDAVPAHAVHEIHLSGHHLTHYQGRELRIDDHGSRVCDEVWALYRHTIERLGPVPTLIEWDTDVPPLATLMAEAARADAIAAEVAAAARCAEGVYPEEASVAARP